MADDEIIERLVGVPMRTVDDKGQSLETKMHRGEPAVVIDGTVIVRYSMLKRLLAKYQKAEGKPTNGTR